MPKMVMCFRDGIEDGKFFDENQIPKGWIIDRIYNQDVNPGGKIKEMTLKELEAKGVIIKSPEEVKLSVDSQTPEEAKLDLPETTDGLDITGQADKAPMGTSTFGAVGVAKPESVRRKPGPKPRAKTEE